jgi:uncharacterized protein YeeX (DUF496 family)
MMFVSLTCDQIEAIIEALKKNYKQKSDQYLINYLENLLSGQKNISLDEIPF